MSVLTEVEIFDCLTVNFREAAEHCESLARLPRKGPTYVKLRECLRLIEGAARQAGHWREDSRWFQIGLMMGEAHKRAGDWLRGIKGPNGQRVKLAEGHLHPLFVKLAEHLRAGHVRAEEYRTRATGKVGMILPEAKPAPHRDTRPVAVSLPAGLRKMPSGLIVPAGVQVSAAPQMVQ